MKFRVESQNLDTHICVCHYIRKLRLQLLTHPYEFKYGEKKAPELLSYIQVIVDEKKTKALILQARIDFSDELSGLMNGV